MWIVFSSIASQEKAEGKRFSCNFLGTLCYCLFDRCMSFERVLHIIPFCLTILRMTLAKFRSTVR